MSVLEPFVAYLCGRGVAAAALLADGDAAPFTDGLRAVMKASDTFLRLASLLGDEPAPEPRAWAARTERLVTSAARGEGLAWASYQVGEAGGRLLASGWWRRHGDEARAGAEEARATALLRDAGDTTHPALRAKIDALRALAARLRTAEAPALDALLTEVDAALADQVLQGALAGTEPAPPAPDAPTASMNNLYRRILRQQDLPDDLETDNRLRAELGRLIAPHDAARGELIALQLELNVMRRSKRVLPGIFPLIERETALISQHGAAWSPVLPGVDSVGFRRGFVGHISLGARAFLEHAAGAYALAPITEAAITEGAREHAAELFVSPQLARLRALRLPGAGLGDTGLAMLAASHHAGALVYLDLADNGITLEGLRALARSTTIPRLQLVRLAGNPADAVSAQLEAEFGHLRWLHADRWPPHADTDAVRAELQVPVT